MLASNSNNGKTMMTVITIIAGITLVYYNSERQRAIQAIPTAGKNYDDGNNIKQ